jgi:hypothetical protein
MRKYLCLADIFNTTAFQKSEKNKYENESVEHTFSF